MVTATNDVTGDALVSRVNTKEYEENFEKIFGKKKNSSKESNPLCDICGKDLKATKECAWTSCPLNWNENRIDVVGANGNEGLHY